MQKKWENNGTEEMGLLTPIPGESIKESVIGRTNIECLGVGGQ